MTLPPELWDQIIDNLWDDRPSLAACSLACRAWIPTARLHIFRTISLRTVQNYMELRALLDASDVESIGHYIREVFIFCKKLRYSIVGVETFRTVVPLLMERLNAVERMTLDCEGLYTDVALDVIYSTSLPPRMSSLTLVSAHFHSTDNLTRVFERSPRFSSIALRGCSFNTRLRGGGEIDRNQHGHEPVRLEELCIDNITEDMDSVAGAVLDFPFDVQFRRLVWKAHVVVRYRQLLRQYLKRGAPFLEHFSLIPNYLGLSCMPRELEGLSLCIRLESLHIKCDCSNYKWISLALSSVPTDCLKRVFVEMDPHIDMRGNLHTFVSSRFCNWEVIDKHLVRLGRSPAPPVVLLQYLCLAEPKEQDMLGTIINITDCLPRSRVDGVHLAISFVGKKDMKVYMRSSVAETFEE